MNRYVAGTCTLHLNLTPQASWLVRGQEDQGQQTVLLPLYDTTKQPFVPASSLKGVLRSTAERILRSMQPGRSLNKPPLADDPFVHTIRGTYGLRRGEVSDSELREWNEHHHAYKPAELEPSALYTILSPASQLFGCTLHAGLVTLDDAHIASTKTTTPNTTEPRSHVAIDRFTGSVGEGPYFEKHASATTRLHTKLTITNFALWHIGLLALVFQEINQGYVHIGGNTRKGQGKMQIEVPRIDVCYTTAIYTRSSATAGIVSAQAWLAGYDDRPTDVPDAVREVEQSLVLLPNVAPQPVQNWRDAGLTRLQIEKNVEKNVEKNEVADLFTQAVEQAWCPWVAKVVAH